MKRASLIALAVIVLAGLSLRVIFYSGVVHRDSLEYVRAANELAHGHVWAGAAGVIVQRMTTYVPVALSFRLFGVGHASTVLWPLASSLAEIVLVFLVTRLLSGTPAALIAALLWAMLPADITLATAVLPDGPLTMFGTAAVYCVLRAGTSDRRRSLMWYGFSGACLGAAILAKQTAFVTCGFVLLVVARRLRRDRAARIGVAAVVVVAVGLFYYNYKLSGVWNWGFYTPWIDAQTLTQTMTDWFSAVLRTPEFLFILPLAFVALTFQLAAGKRGERFAAVWLAVSFLALELATRTPFRYTPFVPEEFISRHSLFVMVPAVVLIGGYFANRFDEHLAAWVSASVAIAVVGVAWIVSRGAPTLSASLMRWEAWQMPFATISSVAAGGAVFGAFASPVWAAGDSSRWKTRGMIALLACVALAALYPAYELSTRYRRPSAETTVDAIKLMRGRPDLPWLAQSDGLAYWLDYESQFKRGFDYANPQSGTGLRVVPPAADAIGSAYVFVDQSALTEPSRSEDPGPDYLREPPKNWYRIAVLGPHAFRHLLVYRVLTPQDAARELSAARAAYDAHISAATTERLQGAQINFGDYCPAARRRWAAHPASEEALRDLFRLASACFGASPQIGGPNLVKNGDFSNGLEGWARPSAPGVDLAVERDPADAAPMLHVKAPVADQKAIVLQSALLEPDTLYAYEATVKSTTPVVSLYWQSGGAQFESEGANKEWTRHKFVFLTPHWDGKPHPADIIPFLLKAPADVWLKDVKLSKLSLD